MLLHINQLLLRDIALNDVSNIHALHSLPEVDKYNTMGLSIHINETEEFVNIFIKAHAELPRVKYDWVIEDIEGNFIGLIGLNLGKLNYHSGEVWYKLHPQYWRKGYATESLKCVLNFGFCSLKLHRIHAGCATENIASIKVLEKVGFIKEGHHRKILPIRGAWVDNYEYAILEEDYLKINQ
jgi:[ribosomal protein S5]-alanine N-acetyltransferase